MFIFYFFLLCCTKRTSKSGIWKLLAIRLKCLRVWLCHYIRKFPFWISQLSSVFWWFLLCTFTYSICFNLHSVHSYTISISSVINMHNVKGGCLTIKVIHINRLLKKDLDHLYFGFLQSKTADKIQITLSTKLLVWIFTIYQYDMYI